MTVVNGYGYVRNNKYLYTISTNAITRIRRKKFINNSFNHLAITVLHFFSNILIILSTHNN